ncbi:hypothetical protein ACYOEI_07295 [Singulisphaera rosea]
MSDSMNLEPRDSPPTGLDAALRTTLEIPLPVGLLASCLATVPEPIVRRSGSSFRRPLVAFWAAAAIVFVMVGGYLMWPRKADAAELLHGVKAAWVAVPALHQVVRIQASGGTRTEESWVVRHGGFRQETRHGDELVAVVVNNARWEFRWDVRSRVVAAWSTALDSARHDPSHQGLVLDRDDFEAWARAHRAEIDIDSDSLDGREVRRVQLRWAGGGVTQTSSVWFDPGSLLPLKQVSQGTDGTAFETVLDYPKPDAIAGDLFDFAMPRDVLLEVNDPDLGRSLYSQAQPRKSVPGPISHPKEGVER